MTPRAIKESASASGYMAQPNTPPSPAWLLTFATKAGKRRPIRSYFCHLPASRTPVIGLAVRTGNNPAALASAVRAAVWSVDKDQPVYDVQTMQARVSEAGGHRRTQTILLTAFGLLAMCLAAIGIFGVVSEAANQRTREIGVRMALGAEAADVVRMVMRRSLGLALAGIAIGLAASLYLTRFIQSLLFGVNATDALAFAGAVAVLLAVALIAGYLPARRAARIDPAAVLRSE